MKVLVAYNGSEAAKAALDQAKRYARAFEAKVLVLTSMEGGQHERLEDITQAQEELESARQRMQNDGIDCDISQLARGYSPGEDIVRFARENDVDQIYVGIEQKSRTRKFLLGSTAQHIILYADCPVTTVKE